MLVSALPSSTQRREREMERPREGGGGGAEGEGERAEGLGGCLDARGAARWLGPL